ncbi:MAG: PD40 domain-containing protein, partial [Planctomycetaceae bacterium]|nr:PD40 domain-containing protein [Planctomycetaceae bacterium]
DVSKKSTRVIKRPASVRLLAWHPHRDQIAVLSGNESLHILDLENDQEKILTWQDPVSHSARPVVWSPDGKVLTCGSREPWLRLWNADGTGVTHKWKVPGKGFTHVSWNSNNHRLTTLGIGDKVRFWTAEGKQVALLEGQEVYRYLTPVWSPDGKTSAILGRDGTIRFANQRGQILSVYQDEDSRQNQVRWSPHSDLLAVAGTGDVAKVKLLDTDGRIVKTLQGDVTRICQLDWHPQAHQLAMIDLEGTVRLWDIKDTKSTIIGQHQKQGGSLAWSPDGKWLASSSSDLKIWNTDGKLQTTIVQSENVLIDQLAWNAQSTWVAVQLFDRSIRLWKPNGETGPTLHGTALSRESMAWNPQGDRIACSTRNHSLIVWDTSTGSPLWMGLELQGGKSAVIDSKGQLSVEDENAFNRQFVFVERVDGKTVFKTAGQWRQSK